MKKPVIAVLGSCVCDIILRLPCLPVREQDINIQASSWSLGGCAYHVANILENLSLPYLLFAPIGKGIYGEFVLQQLHQQGITSLVENVPEENGCCYCLVEPNGERTFLSLHGAEYRFQKEWFQRLDAYDIDSVYICGLEIEEASGEYILSWLREHPHVTIYFAPGPRILQIPKERMDMLCAMHAHLHVNAKEAMTFSKQSNVSDAAKALYALNQAVVIITMGSEGALVYDGKTMLHMPAQSTTVVDTIGAGDTHIAALIAQRYLGNDWEASLAFANQVAALTVAQKGASLDKEALLSYIKSRRKASGS